MRILALRNIMKFGSFVKNQREKRELTQPQAAESIGIEQSYLSKLETAKSFPSPEIYARIKQFYDFKNEDLVESVDEHELEKMQDIDELRAARLHRLKRQNTHAKRWLICAFISLLLSGFFFAFYIVGEHKISTYHYRSLGVLYPQETKHSFAISQRSLIDPKKFPEGYTEQQKMLARLDIVDVFHSEFRGDDYTVALEQTQANDKAEDKTRNKRRVFELQNFAVQGHEHKVPRNAHAIYFMIPAIVFLLSTLMSIFMSYRWKALY